MDIDNLVKMANQIARFFEAWPDQAAARHEVANHLKRFWDPRMRATLVAHLAAGPDAHVRPLVMEAAAALRSERQQA